MVPGAMLTINVSNRPKTQHCGALKVGKVSASRALEPDFSHTIQGSNCQSNCLFRLQANLVPYATTTAEDPALQFRYNPGDDFCDPDIGKRLLLRLD